MELIFAVAILVVFWLLRDQGRRLRAVEAELSALKSAAEGAIERAEAPALPAATAMSVSAGIAATAEGPESAPEPAAVLPTETHTEPVAETGPWQAAAATAAQSSAEPPASAQQPPASSLPGTRGDIETALGTRWAVWVGGLALALGGVFLVRYSIEAGYFGPAMRLTVATLFGFALAAGGEAARRFGFRAPIGGLDAAYVPAILTGAASFTLFAVCYSAFAVYGYLDATAAFVLLAMVALATLASALLHGQALAGLGLLGSYLTPGLVATSAPNPWTFFTYLAIVLIASLAVASFRRWRFLAAAAYVGAGLWSIAYLAGAVPALPLPVTILHLLGIAALVTIWQGRQGPDEARRTDAASVAAAVFAALVAAMLLPAWQMPEPDAGVCVGLLVAGMLAAAAWRRAAEPLLHAGGIVIVALAGRGIFGGRFDIDLYAGHFFIDGTFVQQADDPFLRVGFALAILFLGLGIWMARSTVAIEPNRAARWAGWAVVVPLWVLGAAWLTRGDLNVDWRFATPALGLALVLVGAGEWTAMAERRRRGGGWAVRLLLSGAAAALCFGLLAGFGPFWTTVLTALAAALPAVATRWRSYRVLGWMSAGFAAVTLARAGIDPTVIGAGQLGTRPFLNALLPGYLVPAAVFAYAAWQLARTTGGRPRLAMEAFAALFALVGAAMLVRHAMNGGVIDTGAPTLAEQSIYSLIMIGAGAILLALDRRAPSPVFRWGSMAAGVFGVAMIALAHFLALNPLFTNESTGTIPFLNLLLLAYLLPAAALAALALRARGLRPNWYVALLAAAAAAVAFAYVTLSVRRIFHGEFIGLWKGFGAVETYTYSAVWLALGVAILAIGLRFGSRVLRLGSGVLVVAAVAKVFLYDMRELEGVLRALSFIGLGGVLIGIGMFYQRMLASAAR